MKMIRGICQHEEGTIIVIVAAGMMAILLCASMTIDVGSIVTARNQLQSAVDAAALAGASGLLTGHTVATQQAIRIAGQNTVHNQPVSLSPGDITFPSSRRIQVTGRQTIPTYFMGLIGIRQVRVTAVAACEMATLIGTRDLRPWAVPQLEYSLGEPVAIKIGDPTDPNKLTNPGFFYPVDYPPVNRGDPISGGREYLENISYGADCMVYIDDILMVEPGNKVGPTSHGVNDLIDLDPGAYWGDGGIKNSRYAGFSSPRIVKVPLWDPNFPPSPGRNTLVITGLAAFFLERVQGRDVIGRFIEMTTTGVGGQGGYSTLYKIRLIQ